MPIRGWIFWSMQKSARSADPVKQLLVTVGLKALGHTTGFPGSKGDGAQTVLAEGRSWQAWDIPNSSEQKGIMLSSVSILSNPFSRATVTLTSTGCLGPRSPTFWEIKGERLHQEEAWHSPPLHKSQQKSNKTEPKKPFKTKFENSAKDTKDLISTGSPTNPSWVWMSHWNFPAPNFFLCGLKRLNLVKYEILFKS